MSTTTPRTPSATSKAFFRFVRAHQRRYADKRILVYRCSSMGFCGGHGDRLNGILSMFLLALVTKRAFYIDSPRPLPL